MKVLCHRGINLGQSYIESSRSSFEQALESCDGLELDVQLSKDEQLFVWHDQGAERLTNGALNGPLKSYSFAEMSASAQAVSPICVWNDVVDLMAKYSGKLFAIHCKGPNQNDHFLKYFVDALNSVPQFFSSLLIFDLKLETAQFIKKQLPSLPLALSVSHEFDIHRYNGVTDGTLYNLQTACENSSLFDWAWLDEWDLRDSSGTKKFYSSATVDRLKAAGLKVAVVSPELHATSPGLLGTETHEQGRDIEALKVRWQKLKAMGIDAICTDYPNLLKQQLLP